MLYIYHSCFTLTSAQNNIYPNAAHDRGLLLTLPQILKQQSWEKVSVALEGKLESLEWGEEDRWGDKIGSYFKSGRSTQKWWRFLWEKKCRDQVSYAEIQLATF